MEPGDQELYLQEVMQGKLTLTRDMPVFNICISHQLRQGRPVLAAIITTTAKPRVAVTGGHNHGINLYSGIALEPAFRC